MKAIEYCLGFLTKAEAENALDYYENQPGYQDGWVLLPASSQECWQLHLVFAPERACLLSNHSILTALGAVQAGPVSAAAR